MDAESNGVFRVGDHIEVVYPKSKHFGKTGVVIKVGDPRLSVRFDNGLPGTFVDVAYARLIAERGGHNETHQVNNIHPMETPAVSGDEEDDDDYVLVEMFDRLAVQTAITALADANNMADVERAINEQASRIREHAAKILRQRRNNNNRHG
jgi:hypothetical protein